MRIVSWTIVAGSILALAYTGVYPQLKDFSLPEINSNEISGTISSRGPAGTKVETASGLAESSPDEADAACAGSDVTAMTGVQDSSPQNACEQTKLVLK